MEAYSKQLEDLVGCLSPYVDITDRVLYDATVKCGIDGTNSSKPDTRAYAKHIRFGLDNLLPFPHD